LAFGAIAYGCGEDEETPVKELIKDGYFCNLDEECQSSFCIDIICTPDSDKDGYPSGEGKYTGSDCDDNNPSINPGVAEIPYNGLDDDCNLLTRDDDLDGDGYYILTGAIDCDDNNPSIYPNAPELCDLLDNQCPGDIGYGQIDEGVQNTYYRDFDDDGYGNPSSTTLACTVPVGYVEDNTDCNDNDATIYPGAPEICDEKDNQCPGDVGYGQIDEGVQNTYYRDFDDDGYGSPSSTTLACSVPVGYVTDNTDCDDIDPNVNPGVVETPYNGTDDDCNSLTKDDDLDGDGFYVLVGTEDCNDYNSNIYPGAPEICDVIDNQCPGDVGYGEIDEGLCCDVDSDGYYSNSGCGTAVDCNDTDNAVYPGAPEICNDMLDNQCLGDVGYGKINEDCIAFHSNRNGNNEIYVMNADGSNQTRLTNNSASDWNAAWSPDGTKIAFMSYRDDLDGICDYNSGTMDCNIEIYVMNANGGNEINLTNHSAEDVSLVWSPDGSKIAFTSKRDGNAEVYVMNADGSNLTNLTNNPADDYNCFQSWSPDGSKIAFFSFRDDLDGICDINSGTMDCNWEIYVMNADGTDQTRLTNNPTSDKGATWSPDGTKIAFRSDRNGYPNFEIYVMNADGSNQTRLTNNSENDYDLSWSSDGSKIVFCSDWEIYVMNADGSGKTNVSNSPAADYGPAWSSDGTKVLFQSNRGPNFDIYVVNADGSNLTNLTAMFADDYNPSWSP